MSRQSNLFSKHRDIFVVMGVVLLSLVVAKKVHDTQLGKVRSVKDRIRREEQKAFTLERIIVLDEDLKKLRGEGWPETDFAPVVAALSQLGDGADMRIQDITPKEKEEQAYLIAIPFLVNAEATFHSLAKFLLDVQAMPRLMRIQEVTLAPETNVPRGAREVPLRISIKGEALYFK